MILYSNYRRYKKNPMKDSLKTGLSFGLTSGVITTLGLMVGLESGTGSRLAVIGGVLTIAIADAMSDALGIHVSKESEANMTPKEVWESTFFTFLFKFLVALTFVVPILFLPLTTAIFVSIGWGLSLLAILSYKIAKDQKESPWHVIGEHVLVSILVITITHNVGNWISLYFSDL